MPRFLTTEDFRKLELRTARRRGSVPANASTVDGRLAPAVRALLTAGQSGRDAADDFLAGAPIKASRPQAPQPHTDKATGPPDVANHAGGNERDGAPIVAPARALLRRLATLWWAIRQYKLSWDESAKLDSSVPGCGDSRKVRAAMLEVLASINLTLDATGCSDALHFSADQGHSATSTPALDDASIIMTIVDKVETGNRLVDVFRAAAKQGQQLLQDVDERDDEGKRSDETSVSSARLPRTLFDEVAALTEVVLEPHIETFWQSDAGVAFERGNRRHTTTSIATRVDFAGSADRSQSFGTRARLLDLVRPVRHTLAQVRPRPYAIKPVSDGATARLPLAVAIPAATGLRTTQPTAAEPHSPISPKSPETDTRSQVGFDRRVLILHSLRHDRELEHVRNVHETALKRTKMFRGTETLRDSALSARLRRFAEQEECASVHFLADVLAIRDRFGKSDVTSDTQQADYPDMIRGIENATSDDESLILALEHLVSEYLKPGAVYYLDTINQKASKNFQCQLNEAAKAARSKTAETVGTPQLDWLLPIEQEVEATVREDLYPRFICSELYEDYRRVFDAKYARRACAVGNANNEKVFDLGRELGVPGAGSEDTPLGRDVPADVIEVTSTSAD